MVERDDLRVADIRRLRLEPGDHLLVTLPADTTMFDVQRASEVFEGVAGCAGCDCCGSG